jgi:diaminopimelate epimerase
MKIRFFKMSGAGNDFIVIDNRLGIINHDNCADFVSRVCRRGVSVGADGVILIENSDNADFKWHFFNADGSEAEMCGNGARCAARFAFLEGIAGEKLSFETLAGVINAEVLGHRVKLGMSMPHGLELDIRLPIEGKEYTVNFINTGVPHTVKFVQELENYDVHKMGKAIRFHPHFQPAGTNANFVVVRDRSHIDIRTYERGVEDETLACGTGSVAAALVAAAKGLVDSPVNLRTRSGGVLTVHFDKDGTDFRNVYLEGEARVVYEGHLWEEACK